MEGLYLIRHLESGMVKIGITSDWGRRSRELAVGDTTELLQLWELPAPHNRRAERELHQLLSWARLPQSEWFNLDGAAVLGLMQPRLACWQELARLQLDGEPQDWVSTGAGLARVVGRGELRTGSPYVRVQWSDY